MPEAHGAFLLQEWPSPRLHFLQAKVGEAFLRGPLTQCSFGPLWRKNPARGAARYGAKEGLPPGCGDGASVSVWGMAGFQRSLSRILLGSHAAYPPYPGFGAPPNPHSPSR